MQFSEIDNNTCYNQYKITNASDKHQRVYPFLSPKINNPIDNVYSYERNNYCVIPDDAISSFSIKSSKQCDVNGKNATITLDSVDKYPVGCGVELNSMNMDALSYALDGKYIDEIDRLTVKKGNKNIEKQGIEESIFKKTQYLLALNDVKKLSDNKILANKNKLVTLHNEWVSTIYPTYQKNKSDYESANDKYAATYNSLQNYIDRYNRKVLKVRMYDHHYGGGTNYEFVVPSDKNSVLFDSDYLKKVGLYGNITSLYFDGNNKDNNKSVVVLKNDSWGGTKKLSNHFDNLSWLGFNDQTTSIEFQRHLWKNGFEHPSNKSSGDETEQKTLSCENDPNSLCL